MPSFSDDVRDMKFFKDTDGRIERVHRLVKRGVALGVAVWLVWVAGCLALVGGLAYVVWHFLTKVW